MFGIIYKITNLLNNKVYVGQTTVKPETRWKRHCYPCQSNYKMPITRAIKKYGKENFSFEVVQQCSTKEILDKRELFYIKKFKSSVYEHGYNVCEVIDGRVTVSAETRKKHSNDMKRINATPERVEINKQQANVCRGKKPKGTFASRFVGVHYVKLNKKWRGSLRIFPNRYYTKLFDTEEEAFEAYKELAAKFGIHPSHTL